eukprot:m.209076 g.209076  ORF g.209076 m.209076 type:complete len:54 (+) comp16936_c0_seq5:1058-1219(+)
MTSIILLWPATLMTIATNLILWCTFGTAVGFESNTSVPLKGTDLPKQETKPTP